MRRSARLGEPEDRKFGVTSPSRRGLARLGEPRRLSEGGLSLGKPGDRHCGLFLLVWCRFRGPVCDCCGLPRGPLYDLIESVIA